MWNALSAQYVLNRNGKDVDVYLPKGEIGANTVFWNYELNTLKKMEMEAGNRNGKINYHRLTSQTLDEVGKLEIEIKNLKAELSAIKNEIALLQTAPNTDATKRMQLENKKLELKEAVQKLDDRKYDIHASEKSCEIVPFEKVQFKGMQVHKRNFTVGDLIKVGDMLKKHLQKQKDKAKALSNPNSPPNSLSTVCF